jgi:hypothetical protein
MSHTDPDYLAELEKETEFLNQKGRRGNDRIVLKDVGEAMLLRIVPFVFDDKGKWFARIARHWIANRPYICTKDTDPAHGGDPDGKCEMCDVVDKLNRSSNKTVSSIAYKMTAVPQYLAMAVQIEHVSASGVSTQFRGNELKKARELWLYKEAFQDVMTIFKTYLRRSSSKLSIVDPIEGCDLWMTKSRRGIRFDRADPLPLPPKSANPDEFMDAVLKSISWKADKPVTGADLDDLLIKIEDLCLDSRSSRGDDRGGRGRDDDRGGRGRDDSRGGGRDDRGGDDRGRGRDDDRGGRRDDDRGSSRPASRDDERGRDERRSDAPRTESRSRDDRPASRDDGGRGRDDDRGRSDDRGRADDRGAGRDDERRPASRSDDRGGRDDRPVTRDDDRGSRTDSRGREDDRGGRRDDDRGSRPASRDDDRGGSRRDDRGDRHPDLEAVAGDGSEGEERRPARDMDDDGADQRPTSLRNRDPEPVGGETDDPPPMSSRVTGARREIAPPPAAVTGGSRPAASREEREDEDEALPDGDKDRAPAAAPAEGEVVAKAADARPADQPAARASSLTSSIRDRVRKHDAAAK